MSDIVDIHLESLLQEAEKRLQNAPTSISGPSKVAPLTNVAPSLPRTKDDGLHIRAPQQLAAQQTKKKVRATKFLHMTSARVPLHLWSFVMRLSP